MIYVIEGPDGVGKSTLAKALSDKVKAITIHSSFDKTWPIFYCHMKVMSTAKSLSMKGIPVILDRWVVSEYVYGTVFRDGPAYDIDDLIERYKDHITWIYCRNDNVIENHRKNTTSRIEMFDDMELVSVLFDEYINGSNLPWKVYDFNKITTDDFLDTL